MSSVAARIWEQQILGYVPHTSVSGETWQLIACGIATGNGSATGTTLVDTNMDSGGADTYNGRYWVEILSGACKGLWKRVVDDDGSGTLTLENNGFPAQIVTAVEYKIWLSPEPVVVVDSSGGETDMVDAVRTEADVNGASTGFWAGYYAVPITGNRRGKIAKITDFTPGSGTFVLAAGLGGALAAGDVVLLRKFADVGSLALGPAEDYHSRLQNRVNMSKSDGTPGARAGTIGFHMQIMGSGALSASGSAAGYSPASGLMEACGLEEVIGTSMTTSGAPSTTSIPIATGTWENIIKCGMPVMYNGNVSFVTAITDGAGGDDTLTVSPPFPLAPTTATTLYAGRLYQLATDADVLGCVVELEIDGIRHTMTGCKGNVELVSGAVPEWGFTLNIDHWVREIEAAPYTPNTAYPTQQPVLESDRIFYLTTTKVDVKGFTATPGTVMTAKMVQGAYGVNGRAGFHVTDYKPGGTFREVVSSSGDAYGRDSPFLARTSYVLAAIYGSHGNCAGVRMPVARLIQSPHPENGDGIAEHASVFEAQDAGLANDGTPTAQKLPDFAFFIF